MRTSLPVLFLFFLLTAAFGEETPSLAASMRLTPTVLAVRSVLPWVVNIGTERMVKTNDGYDAFYNQFFGTFYRARTKMVKEYFPLGSGVIVDPRGLVLTNHHVVRRANNAEVRLWNGKSYPAVLVGYDAPSDLCLLRLSGDFDEYWGFHLAREHERNHRSNYADNIVPEPIPKPRLRLVKK